MPIRMPSLLTLTMLALCIVPLSAQELATKTITATEPDSEFRILIQASAPDTSWQKEGHECALLRISVDGVYDQHVFTVQGERQAEYEFLLGPLALGDHALRIDWDRSWTPELLRRPEVRIVSVTPIASSDISQEPLLRAPIIHIRRDTVGRFSDLPLLVYWESETEDSRRRITYTVILSNEDGGTNTERLMSRWGRTTDIEWFYQYVAGPAGIEESYQAPDHKTESFKGRHQGRHPVLYDVTENNNFADSTPDPAQVRLRFVPVFADLKGKTRESVMDRFPWTYAIMAREMTRENKLEFTASAATAAISDQRNYLYLEVCARQRGTELFFEANTRTSSRWYRSDHADPKARIDRSGCFRTAIELPEGTTAEDLNQVRIQCVPAPLPAGRMPVSSPAAVIESLTHLFLLQKDYTPGPNLLRLQLNRNLRPGQSLTIPVKSGRRSPD